MSGRARQKPPKDALRIRVESDAEAHQIYQWMTAGNGFPFHVPRLDEGDLRISHDGRTLYGEKFLVRVGRESDNSRVPRWDYQMNRAGDDLVRKSFAYPIVRSLWDYAPGVAARIGLRPRTRTLTLHLDGTRGVCPRCGEQTASPLFVQQTRVGYACAACKKVGVDR